MQLLRAKNTVKPSVFFALLGSFGIKTAHKMLVKLTPAGMFGRSTENDVFCKKVFRGF